MHLKTKIQEKKINYYPFHRNDLMVAILVFWFGMKDNLERGPSIKHLFHFSKLERIHFSKLERIFGYLYFGIHTKNTNMGRPSNEHSLVPFGWLVSKDPFYLLHLHSTHIIHVIKLTVSVPVNRSGCLPMAKFLWPTNTSYIPIKWYNVCISDRKSVV